MKNHLIWTSMQHVDKLGRLDPATGAWAEFPLMYAETDVRRIEVDPNNPKRVWYSGVLSSRIGYSRYCNKTYARRVSSVSTFATRNVLVILRPRRLPAWALWVW